MKTTDMGLTDTEIGDLFRVLRSLRDRGVAILYVSHRLEEVFELCDRLTIMRNGETAIDPELIALHTQYSVQEKRGFYMPTRKQYLQMKEIVPIYFPLFPMKAAEEADKKAREAGEVVALRREAGKQLPDRKSVV